MSKKAQFSRKKLHCCFNIYKRPLLGLNKKSKSKLEDISIYRQDKKDYATIDFDVRMCYWGSGTAGKILYNKDEKYAGEYKIKIHNIEHYDELKKFIQNFDWNGYVKGIDISLHQRDMDLDKVLKEGWRSLTSKETGKIGGLVTKKRREMRVEK